ncbi:unnamed protein product [Oreochromis niloticus]|nr:unnamed protein product [Mustela putorius furo]
MKLDGQKGWTTPAKVISKSKEPRSYLVEMANGNVTRRNRQHLQPVPGTADPEEQQQSAVPATPQQFCSSPTRGAAAPQEPPVSQASPGPVPGSPLRPATPSADMSAVSSLRSEDQFLCSICLDVFTDPVSTPCGHNFCKNCITQHWDMNVMCQSSMCKETFYTRPHLRVNTLLSEVVAQFRCEAQQKASSSSSEQQAAKPGEVPCDICTGTRLKALKSCLVCQESYCQTHLEPHLTKKGLKKHQLIDAVENLEGRMCKKHDKLLELFCKNDQTCVCVLCSVLDHKNHEFVPLREEYEGKKAELEKTEVEIQQMIQKRRLKIQQIKESVKMSKCAADRQKAEGVQVFTALKESVNRGLKELIKEIEDKQETTEKQAEGLIKDLKQEISELMKRRSEVEQLSRSEDHLRLS